MSFHWALMTCKAPSLCLLTASLLESLSAKLSRADIDAELAAATLIEDGLSVMSSNNFGSCQ